MKKLFNTFILTVLLTNVSMPKAEAGVGILGAGTVALVVSEDNLGGVLLFLSGAIYGGMAAIGGSVIGGITAIFAPSLGVKIIYGSLVLDANGSLPRPALVDNFSKLYPSIDNLAVIEDLADSVNQKYRALNNTKDNVVVHFTQAEVEELFAPADLTKEELAKIALDLK